MWRGVENDNYYTTLVIMKFMKVMATSKSSMIFTSKDWRWLIICVRAKKKKRKKKRRRNWMKERNEKAFCSCNVYWNIISNQKMLWAWLEAWLFCTNTHNYQTSTKRSWHKHCWHYWQIQKRTSSMTLWGPKFNPRN